MQSQDRNAKFYLESARYAAEAVGAIRTVSSLTLESKIYDSYTERLNVPVKSSLRYVSIAMIFFGLSESIELAGKIAFCLLKLLNWNGSTDFRM